MKSWIADKLRLKFVRSPVNKQTHEDDLASRKVDCDLALAFRVVLDLLVANSTIPILPGVVCPYPPKQRLDLARRSIFCAP